MVKDDPMLDLGCNCGYTLNELKKRGYKNLCGIDICAGAIEHGRKRYDLNDIELNIGSFESVLPRFVDEKRKFGMVFSGGASISLVHPSFDIVKYICAISRKYVVFVDEDSLGLLYPRLWEYEFYRNGFRLVKFLRPSDGSIRESGKNDVSSIAVYQRIGEE
jgi:SAM-dependent methyltransferase